MPTLTLKFKDSVLADFPLERGQSLNIGRRKNNDVVIDNLAVSGHHAKIDSVGDGFVFVDLRSKNGSFVNEQLVTSHWLNDGDLISIGKHVLLFSAGDQAPEAGGTKKVQRTMVMDTDQYRSMMEKSAAAAAGKNRRSGGKLGVLEYLGGDGGRIKLKSRLVRIGRAATADIPVKGWWVGRTAATISRHPDGYYLNYVAGLVRPRLNRQVVKQPTRLQDRDVIAIGSAKWQFFLKNTLSG
jgi:pSer/pThr/pTyr-binding forkhead associated (FHA) protein